MKERLREVWLELTADRKKAATLGVLLVMGLVVGVRTALRAGPASARAASAAEATVGEGGDGFGAEQPLRFPDLTPPPRFSSGSSATRDLFRVSEEHFPAGGRAEASAGAKSEKQTAEKESALAAEAARARVEAAARRIRVRSVMVGANAVAIVEVSRSDGVARRALRIGDEALGLRVSRIELEGVTVERDGLAVLLPTPSPGRDR